MKAIIIIVYISFINISEMIANQTCQPYSPWDLHHTQHHLAQGGVSVCNLESHSPDHYLLQNFQCGESTIRVVLCENGFDFFKRVSKQLHTKYQMSCAFNRSSYSKLFLLQNFMNINGTTLFLFFLFHRVSGGPQQQDLTTLSIMSLQKLYTD